MASSEQQTSLGHHKRRIRKILLITGPSSKVSEIFIKNLMEILLGSFKLVLIGRVENIDSFSDLEKYYDVTYKYSNGLGRIITFLIMQFEISCHMIKEKNADICLFFLSNNLIIPIIISRILRRGQKIIMFPGGLMSEAYKRRGSILSYPFKLFEKLSYRLSDHIILYSPNLIKEWNLQKYENKILIAHEHFLDLHKFRIKKEFCKRDNLVGYIGRLSEEKGILNFVEAIPEILKERDDLDFRIGGDGQLRDEIEKYLDENGLNDKVNLAGWIPHDKLPDYLGQLRLIVLPSHSEGLPNIMLEAIACGTPVLATPVGAIPDIIKDGEAGFIMKNNSPECIAKKIISVLNHPNLDTIIRNARALVEREFTYEAAVERYWKIMESIW